VARATSPVDGASLLATLAEGLGARPAAGASRAVAWRALVDAARVARLQGQAIVLAVDDEHHLHESADRLDLERLVHADPHPGARLTVIRAGRPAAEAGPEEDPWVLAIRFPPLTRGEAEAYLLAKLAAAGREEPTFTPRAITRLHALAGGVPRTLDRLAGLALLAGAARGREIITPEIIDGVAAECVTPGLAPGPSLRDAG
jgi:type II secretory pathway predicted ATPase ExeA